MSVVVLAVLAVLVFDIYHHLFVVFVLLHCFSRISVMFSCSLHLKLVRVFREQPLYLHGTVMKYAYTLLSLNPMSGISSGMLLLLLKY